MLDQTKKNVNATSQTIERNHLLSQVILPLLTTTLTQSLDLFCKQSQVSSQVSDIKGLTFDPMIYLYSYSV